MFCSSQYHGLSPKHSSATITVLTILHQVLSLLHYRLGPRRRLHHPPPLANIPTAVVALNRHDRWLRSFRPLARRSDRHLGSVMGAIRVSELELQHICVWRESPTEGAECADTGVASAEEHMPKLAGSVCIRHGRGDLLVLDHGHGLPGFCW